MSPKNRPAEAGGATGAIALIVGRALGIKDPDTLVAIGAIIGFVPAAITWLVVLVRKGPQK